MTDSSHTPTPTPGGRTWRDQLTRFFTRIRFSGLNRDSDRWLLGVCGAIARRTGLDPLIVRGVALVLGIVGTPVFFAYALGWALLPDATGRIHTEEVVRGNFRAASVTSVVVLVITMFSFFQNFRWGGVSTGWVLPGRLDVFFSVAWAIALTGGLVWLVIYLVRRGRNQRPGPPGSTFGNPGAPGNPGTPGTPGAPSASDATRGRTPGAAPGGPSVSNDAASIPGSEPRTTSGDTAGASMTGAMPFVGTATAEPSRTSSGASPGWEQTASGWEPTGQARILLELQQARRAARAAARRASRPGTGFTAIVLGLAIAGGAAATGVVATGTATAPVSAALALGLAVALGVMAIGVIVSGIRGRRGGALSAFALLAGIALLVVGVFPVGTQFVAAGDPRWQVTAANSGGDQSGYALGAGQATIDLGLLANSGPGDDRIVDVWVGLGETLILLPAGEPVRVESHVLVGSVTTLDVEGSQQRNGLFLNEARTYNDGMGGTTSLIRIWSSVGQVTITESASTTSR